MVVYRHNGDHGRKVYTYLRDNGVRFMQFIPIVEQRGIGQHAEGNATADSTTGEKRWDDRVSSRSVRPEQLGWFLIEVFDEWIQRDVGQVFVQLFDQTFGAWLGHEPSLCVFRKQCGRALAMEHNGDVYSCDHFVESEYRLGNIQELPLIEMANSTRQREFGVAKESTLPQYCRDCEVRFVCNGECPKNRFIETPGGEAGLNYLCGGYRMFFNHVRPMMELMVAEHRAGRHVSNVMHRLRGRVVPAAQRSPSADASSVGRNDPCPCGSGRKYKKCCALGRD
ncbi:MAG: SPASM domain-containing protein [Planctomycetaceae bacterium]|nr:SPASM domain-containing protein [Planctomycetaceae bacterium]